ncbi:hypothetical protein L2E82_21794 [Cichorium intybus]|uniref:Uncharacterized protein n=1 Tax=Cichorium intybus TaxID=13427 RepID=A0ACB9DWV5_CICIN|nr:hypothetical protein L2E82_21794 [Cichorium intybus]
MRFIYVPCPHTADALAEVLYDSLCDWNIDRKLSTLTKLEEFVKHLFKEYQSSNPSTKSDNAGCGSSSFDVGLSSGHRDGFKKLLSEIASITSTHDESGGMTELDNYLREKLLPKDMELDLLVWWKTNGFKYPTLQRIAKDILAVPISTVASESAFSTSGRLISPHRSRLHPKTLEALMCAQSWLLNEIRETCSDESEAYCRSIDYDYDVEEGVTKEDGSGSGGGSGSGSGSGSGTTFVDLD